MVATETIGNVVAGDSPEKRNLLFDFAWYQKKEGYADSTGKTRCTLLKVLLKSGADLNDSESVKDAIARQTQWCNKRKINAVDAYSLYLKMNGRTWDPPRYTFAEKLPFIPKEKEIDDIIAGCGPKTSTFILLLKETAMRSGEGQRLQWVDIDFESKTIRITPEKGSNPRIFRISDKLIGMLSRLRTYNRSRNPNKVFANDIKSIKRTYLNQRKRLAIKLGNPRLELIHFHTFRHWKATTLYHKTKDLLYVQQFLGHKSLSNTLKYIQLSNACFDENTDHYICKVAGTVQDATELVELGFDYVTEMDGLKLFRKPA